MKVRYHIVPKAKQETAMLIESDDKSIKVKNVLSSEEAFKLLHSKLDHWYKEKQIQAKQVEAYESTVFVYDWDSEPIHDHTAEEYCFAGGCDIAELIAELEEQHREELELKLTDAEIAEEQALATQIYYDSTMPDEMIAIDRLEAMDASFEDEFFPFATAADEPIPMYEDPVYCDYVPAKSTVPISGSSGESGFAYKGKRRRSFKRDVTDPGMLLGPTIEGDSLPIASVNEEMNNAIFEGIFVGLVLIKTKTEKGLIKGSIVDGTNSIQFVKFVDNYEDAETLLKTMEKVKGVRVQGDVNYDDKFEKDYIFSLRSIQELKKERKRTENRADSRVELHLHTKMSDRDALVNVKELLQTVKDWGHPAVAITDHGVIQAFPEAQDIAGKLGVKVIYGVEGYLIEDEENDTRSHIILLAKNTVGLRNLYKMITISHLQYYKRRPRLPRAVIEDHREGIIIGSACEAGELIRAIVKGESQERLLEIASFYDYLEIQPLENNRFLLYDRRTGEQIREESFLVDINKKVVEIGEILNKPVVATCDVHHLNDDEKIYRQIMLTVSGFKDIERTPSLYLCTTDEMLEEFKYLGEEKAYEVVVTNSRMINDSIDTLQPVPQGKTYSPKIEGADDELTEMCYKKAKDIYGDPLPKVVADRLDYELTRIIGNGYGVLYFIAHKLVRKSLDDGYLVGSRGSVGSSFVATMADITEVNPLPPHYICPNCKHSEFFEKGEYAGGFDLPRKNCPECGTPLNTNGHDIPFAIFMGFNGDKVPDIDLNFSGDYQPRAHKYTEELFGRDNVFRAGTIGTIAEKTAIGYVKKYAEAQDIQARQGFLEALAKGVTGVKNTTGQHPGGIMVCPRDMDVHQFTPVQYPANKKDSGIITTHFDYHSFEGCMTKLDILGHDDPTIIRMLEDITGVDVQTIPFDDPETLSLFSSTKAIGLTPEQLMGDKVASLAVPECGTGFVRRMLEDSKPQHFSDIVRISGFSHGTNVWLDNAQTLIKNGTCKLNEAISTRDDIMNFLMHRDIEPLTCFKVMENVRKGKGIDKLNKVGEKETDYEDQMRAGGIPDWFIDSCKKISYLFPRAHAVAYVMMAFRIAWFKINYPLAFYAAYYSIRAKAYDMKIMASSLEVQRAEFERLKALDRKASNKDKDMMSALEVSMEMKQRGFNFLVADLNHSDAHRFKIHDGALLPPFVAVDSLGEKVADAIVAEREKSPFTSVKDLQRRCKISESILATMRDLGCFGDLPEDEQMSLFG
ncbi:PolC-type DNA polymerase III [Veillonella intestinalis]|uniref:PolC-type DNA polymerase III n=1 Tax=Veillonella intestinalis TaxID=2941341 RepID=UPI0020400FF8|nr:PolC-type DNA polymerase III [Veillonella intestinalis]